MEYIVEVAQKSFPLPRIVAAAAALGIDVISLFISYMREENSWRKLKNLSIS